MAVIRPFRITHYNHDLNGILDKLITPPYDIISPQEQDSYYQAHPWNVIRLILGKQYETDTENNNRYTRAATTLNDWLEQGVLVSEQEPGLAIYQIHFTLPEGGEATIDGVVALVKVDEYGPGKVLPHEKTYSGPKQDQLRLIRSCRSNFTPIHGLVDDGSSLMMQTYESILHSPPMLETKDGNKCVHRVWVVHDERIISRLMQMMSDKSIFIADGHHRYETARAFRDEMNMAGDALQDGGHEYVMMYLTAMSHPGLVILPAHRMVTGIDNFDLSQMLDRLSPYFDIEDFCTSNGDRGQSAGLLMQRLGARAHQGGEFGLAAYGDHCLRLLRLKDLRTIDRIISEDIPASVRGLDVTILGEFILGQGLGLDKDSSEGKIEYTPLAREALQSALDGKVQLSFLLNPTRVEQLRVAAEMGHKLPHKSTYFYPKLSSGLVLNVFG